MDNAQNAQSPSPQETPDLPIQLRVQLIELAASLGEQEADRTWIRFGISLPIQTGLIAIVAYALASGLYGLTLLIAILGCTLSVVSYRILIFSQFAEERWRLDMAALVDEEPAIAARLRARSKSGPRVPRPTPSATDAAKYVLATVFALWIAIGVYSVAVLNI
ncbi:MAG: hypothetical protein QM648_11885 [Solirubrobacterales bacterium]